jgi:hypothetical protein
MASAYGFELRSAQGVVFALSTNAKRDRLQTFGEWEVELRKGVPFACARTQKPNPGEPIVDMVAEAHDAAEKLLDITAVEERAALLCVEPHNNAAWRVGQNGLKVELNSSITFSAEPGDFKLTVTDAEGIVIPDPPYLPPPFHASYRYFRYSQASQNVFESYKNMFLAFESLLDHLAPKQPSEGETEWMERALTEAVNTRGLDLAPFAKPRNKPVEDFLDAHYSAIRCAIFHAKSSSGQSLRPGSLKDYDTTLHQLLAVQALVEHLLKKEFSVRLPTSGFYHKGFGHLLEQLSAVMAILISEGVCPTAEQALNQDEEVDPGAAEQVTFAGANGDLTDEWLFFSEIKAQELPIKVVRSVRLIARPNDHLLLGAIANRINRTLIGTDLALEDVNKLVVNVRCILRNVQSQRSGFSH